MEIMTMQKALIQVKEQSSECSLIFKKSLV